MKLLTETSTQLIKRLQDLNQEIRQKLSSMPSYTQQEMNDLALWLEEVEQMVKDYDNNFLIIHQHLNILKIKYKERLIEVTLKD